MATRDQAIEKPQSIRFDASEHRDRHPQEYYDEIKARFAAERELRLAYRPPGTDAVHVRAAGRAGPRRRSTRTPAAPEPREPITDHVEVLFIGGGFSALLTSARLRERGVESIRIVERGADVGGTWYWNRYPGIACDVVSYDYLPLLDEMQYVPSKHYAEGPEIFAHCQAIARRYDLYELAVFQTTVTSTVWDEAERQWVVTTDRGDRMTATFVICANGTLAKPRLADHRRDGDVRGDVVPHVAVGLRVHGPGPRAPPRQGRRHHRHGRQRRAGRPQPRRDGQGAVRLPAHAVVDRRARRLADRSRVGGPPATGLADQAAGQDHRQGARDRRAQQGAAQRDHPRGEDPPPGERQHRRHDADPPPHRRDRRGPGDGRGAEAVVHDHVQAAVLPQRLPADVQPAQRPPRRHARRGDHEDRPARVPSSTARRTSSTC